MSIRQVEGSLEGFAEFSRRVAAEGAVLLQNARNILPLKDGEAIAIFGRAQIDYYRTGTGSGGSANVPYVTDLLNGLRSKAEVDVDERLAAIYEHGVNRKCH
ncbi:glycoside hydrolase family 3 C-terminal domain-containing protein [Paenibacillus sp. AD87]|uniref:glycoside hydrolase family 3 C-terminal domain-containing protein n=1 Tax=unclassified Paenibacillus TaxID=185978 RepID=UPI0007E3C0A0|nr:hypothetical protein gpAD87_10230 [Paenibacillus sp. AD87]